MCGFFSDFFLTPQTNKNQKKVTYEDQEVEPSKKFVVNIDDPCSCSILHTLAGKHCEETGRYLKNIANFLQTHAGVQFSQIVADFTKSDFVILGGTQKKTMCRDENEDWYFLSVKGFKLRSVVPPVFSLFIEKEFSKSKMAFFPARFHKKRTREREDYEKLGICKLCQILFPPEQLPHKLTMKMLIQAEKQLKVTVKTKNGK